MNIELPNHVIDILTARGLKGDPNDWKFKAARLSNERVYMWFTCNEGFVIENGAWAQICMAGAAFTETDEKTLYCTTLPLSTFSDPGADVTVYQDGSLSWVHNGIRKTADWRDNEALDRIGAWRGPVINKSRSFWIRITGRSIIYIQLNEALVGVAQRLRNIIDFRWG